MATVGSNVTSYSNTGLTASTSYSYRVRAYNSVGDSDDSNPATAVTQAAPVLPIAPTNLAAVAISKSQINLSWTDNSSNETGFRIERCKGPTCTNFALIATVGANVTSFSNTSLSANTTYRYRIYAYNANGNSSYSNIAKATTRKR
jgi:tripartite motif-containing protein 71